MDALPLKRPTATRREAAILLVLGPSVALTEARTAGVSFFERSPPLHSVLLGRCRLEVGGRQLASPSSLAIPAGIRHRVLHCRCRPRCCRPEDFDKEFPTEFRARVERVRVELGNQASKSPTSAEDLRQARAPQAHASVGGMSVAEAARTSASTRWARVSIAISSAVARPARVMTGSRALTTAVSAAGP